MEPGLGNPKPSVRVVLRTVRIIWVALLVGQVMFAGVIEAIRRQGSGGVAADQELPQLLFKVAVGMLIAAIPVAFFVRGMVFGSGETVARDRFSVGTILYMAVLEGVSMFGLVIVLLAREWWPFGVVPGVAFAVQLLGWPGGDRLEEET